MSRNPQIQTNDKPGTTLTMNTTKREKKAPVDFIKKNIMESKAKFKRKPIKRELGDRNRLGVLEFPVDDEIFSRARSMSGRRSSKSSEGSLSKRSGSQKVVIKNQGFNFDIYK
jgi:hypothetical protein